MKSKLLLLLLVTLPLISCGKPKESSEGTTSIEESSSLELPEIPEVFYGKWYMHTSSVFNTNTEFTINNDDTLTLNGYAFAYQGNYDVYDDAFLWKYSSMIFIASYDSEDGSLDFGFQYGETSDIGIAKKEPYSQWDYIGQDWPMEKTNEYLGTTGSLPVYQSNLYYLDLFNSSLYDCRSVEIEAHNTNKEYFTSYLDLLISDHNFVFKSYDGNVKNNTFYAGYDKGHTYSVRFYFDASENEAWLFVYKYNTAIAGE